MPPARSLLGLALLVTADGAKGLTAAVADPVSGTGDEDLTAALAQVRALFGGGHVEALPAATPPPPRVDGDRRDPEDLEIMRAECLTGRLNADELWVALHAHTARDDPARDDEIYYRNLAPSRRREPAGPIDRLDPPCAAFLEGVHAWRQERRRRRVPVASVVEVFDVARGRYVAADATADAAAAAQRRELVFHRPRETNTTSSTRDDPCELVATISHGGLYGDAHDSADGHGAADGDGGEALGPEDRARLGRFLTEQSFAGFTSVLDALDGIRARGDLSLLVAEDAATVALVPDTDRDPHATAAAVIVGLLRDERAVLSRVAEGPTLEATWALPTTAAAGVGVSAVDWARIRREAPVAGRAHLAAAWTALAQRVLVATGNATTPLDCLRRALVWDPGHVPAYLQAAAILQHFALETGSCQAMEVMLAHADPGAFRPGEMRQILTAHFPHCSVVIRMAHLWEHHPAVRYVVGASVIVSFLHGILVALYFFHDKLRGCCRGRQRWWSWGWGGRGPTGKPGRRAAKGEAEDVTASVVGVKIGAARTQVTTTTTMAVAVAAAAEVGGGARKARHLTRCEGPPA